MTMSFLSQRAVVTDLSRYIGRVHTRDVGPLEDSIKMFARV